MWCFRRQWQSGVDGRRVIFVDEVGVRESDCERRYARSFSGTKACKSGRSANTGERGDLHNFMCTMDSDGEVSLDHS